MHVDEFEGAAAKVTNYAVGLVNSGHDAKRGEMRLALSGKNRDSRAANAFGFSDEIAAIARVAAGRRGNRPDTPHGQDIPQATEAAEPIKGRVDGVRRQQAGRLNLSSQPC